MKWKSRKFIAWAVITAMLFVCLMINKIDSSAFTTLLMFIVPIYFGANIVDKKINKEN